jgi:hypothetical protein
MENSVLVLDIENSLKNWQGGGCFDCHVFLDDMLHCYVDFKPDFLSLGIAEHYHGELGVLYSNCVSSLKAEGLNDADWWTRQQWDKWILFDAPKHVLAYFSSTCSSEQLSVINDSVQRDLKAFQQHLLKANEVIWYVGENMNLKDVH